MKTLINSFQVVDSLTFPNYEKVALQFPSIMELVDFTIAIDADNCMTNKMALLLICEVSEKEIELAKNGFKAHVVQFGDA